MNLHSIKDVAEITGIDETRIHYCHRSGKVPEPTYFVANRRIYTDDDLRRVADYFGVNVVTPSKLENGDTKTCTRSTNT